MKGLLHSLVVNYPIDGVVLNYLYYANAFGETDTVGNPACPEGSTWMSGVLNQYANDLVATIKEANPEVMTVLTSYPLGIENKYRGLQTTEIGHQDLRTMAQITDRVMLVFLGTYWVPRGTQSYIPRAIADFRELAREDPWASFLLVDEWEYMPSFYRGLLNFLRAQSQISGFNLHTTLSAVGELGPALSNVQWNKAKLVFQ